MIVIAGNGTVLYSNRVAKGLIQRKDALLLSDGRLGFTDPDIDTTFNSLLTQMFVPQSTETHLKIDGPELDESEYSLRLSSMVGSDNVVEAVLIQIIRMTPIAEVKVPVETLPQRAQSQPARAQAVLRQRYDLTPAESKVCEAMGRLGSLQRAQSEIGISMTTIRSHLNHVYSKLNVSSEHELMSALGQTSDQRGNSLASDDQMQAVAR